MKAEPLYLGRAELAEGPFWHENALWWVDILAGTLNRLDLATGINASRATGDMLGAAVPMAGRSDRFLLGRRGDVALLDWSTGEVKTFADLPGHGERLRLNDGKCDPAGRFLVGSLHLDGEKEQASLYQVGHDANVSTLLSKVSLSNGLAWSSDGSRLFYIDTLRRTVCSYPYDLEDGSIGDERVITTFGDGEGLPDGMAADAEGGLWVALWGGGAVVRLDSQSGECTARVSVPARQVTSCAFGGAKLDTLYITTAWQGQDKGRRAADPLAGSIFQVQPGVAGLPVASFGPQKPRN